MPTPNFSQLSQELQALILKIQACSNKPLSQSKAKQIRIALSDVASNSAQLLADLDPIRRPGSVFDPSKPEIVGRFIGLALLAQKRQRLSSVDKFYGSGIYALYYNGNFQLYAPLSKKEHPIYVGKADPEDPSAKDPVAQGARLAGRLRDHRRTIGKVAPSLSVDDFEYRALVVQSGWQTAAEKYLIHLYEPIWNDEMKLCYGFGKHGDAPKTRANRRSPWDTLHAGRAWAHSDATIQDAKPKATIETEIRAHFAKKPPIKNIQQVFKIFLEEMKQT